MQKKSSESVPDEMLVAMLDPSEKVRDDALGSYSPCGIGEIIPPMHATQNVTTKKSEFAS